MALDMEAIIKDVVEAGMMDRLRCKKRPSKSVEQLIAEQNALLMDVAKRESERGEKEMQEGLAAPWKELRKQFPRK